MRPRTLRFIEDDDVIVRCVRCANAFISEVVDVLDERLHSLAHRPFPFSVANARQFIPGEGLLEDRHERAVSRQIHSACFPERLPTGRDVQPDESLPSTGDACDEHNSLLAIAASAFDDLLNTSRRQAKVPRARVVSRDGLN
jgi:hypothetical protein